MLELVDRTNLSFVDFYHKRSNRFSDNSQYLKILNSGMTIAVQLTV